MINELKFYTCTQGMASEVVLKYCQCGYSKMINELKFYTCTQGMASEVILKYCQCGYSKMIPLLSKLCPVIRFVLWWCSCCYSQTCTQEVLN